MERYNELFPNDGVEEIREVGGNKYRVVKTRCTCRCHTNTGIVHMIACCNNGWVETLIPID